MADKQENFKQKSGSLLPIKINVRCAGKNS